jgi:2-iminobutanoate/2-iminopropanoate deaminase
MKTTISTNDAPAAVGPYSQAIKVNDLVFTAGQLGMDPATGKFAGDDVVSQTQQAMRNLKAVLEASGSSVRQIVKTTIFVTDLGAFKDVNAAYGQFLTDEGVASPPARSTVEVAALPLGGLVEIETIATLED